MRNVLLRITCILLASVICALAASGCSITPIGPGGRGGFRVVPDFGEDPSYEGFYRKIFTEDGRCYFSNGTWCIPCEGGQLIRCSEIPQFPRPGSGGVIFEVLDVNATITEGGTDTVDDEEAGINLPAEFLELTGGLDGDTYAVVAGLDNWQPGDAVWLPVMVNAYSDEGPFLDFSFIWRSNWRLPNLPPPEGVRLLAYVDGDFEDEAPDTMLFRVAGPAGLIREALGEMGTLIELRLGSGG